MTISHFNGLRADDNGDGTQTLGVTQLQRTLVIPAIIEVGESLSTPIDLAGRRLSMIEIPDGFEGNRIIFQVSSDGDAFYDLVGAVGERIHIYVSPMTSIRLRSNDWIGIGFLKIRSIDTAGAVVAQSARRTIGVVVA